MNKGETFVLLWRALGKCDKALVRHIVNRYWLQAEQQLSVYLRQQRLRCVFAMALQEDPVSERWFALLDDLLQHFCFGCKEVPNDLKCYHTVASARKVMDWRRIERHHARRMKTIS